MRGRGGGLLMGSLESGCCLRGSLGGLGGGLGLDGGLGGGPPPPVATLLPTFGDGWTVSSNLARLGGDGPGSTG